jgi:hypothetical protein
VRQAELELEVSAPSTTQTVIEQLAEQHGGDVVSAARDTDHETAVDVHVSIVVPATPDVGCRCFTSNLKFKLQHQIASSVPVGVTA